MLALLGYRPEGDSYPTQLMLVQVAALQGSLSSHSLHLLEFPSGPQRKLPFEIISRLQRRSMAVKRLKMFPIESIVQGYITGSTWSSYQKNGTVCGIALPTGLQESERLHEPLWTPSTKAEIGGKDENISSAGGW